MLKDGGREKFPACEIGPWHFVSGLVATVLLTVTSISKPVISQESKVNQIALQCNVGPVSKEYGETHWLVYSCNDQRSVVIVSAPGNPAMPFSFVFYPSDTGYHLSGEGTGRKETTAAAFEEIKALSVKEISAL